MAFTTILKDSGEGKSTDPTTHGVCRSSTDCLYQLTKGTCAFETCILDDMPERKSTVKRVCLICGKTETFTTNEMDRRICKTCMEKISVALSKGPKCPICGGASTVSDGNFANICSSCKSKINSLFSSHGM